MKNTNSLTCSALFASIVLSGCMGLEESAVLSSLVGQSRPATADDMSTGSANDVVNFDGSLMQNNYVLVERELVAEGAARYVLASPNRPSVVIGRDPNDPSFNSEVFSTLTDPLVAMTTKRASQGDDGRNACFFVEYSPTPVISELAPQTGAHAFDCIGLSADGTRFLVQFGDGPETGTRSSTLQVWERTADGARLLAERSDLPGGIYSFGGKLATLGTLASDGKSVTFINAHKQLLRWDIDANTTSILSSATVQSFISSRNGKHIVFSTSATNLGTDACSTSSGTKLFVMNAESLRCLAHPDGRLFINTKFESPDPVDISDDGRTLALSAPYSVFGLDSEERGEDFPDVFIYDLEQNTIGYFSFGVPQDDTFPIDGVGRSAVWGNNRSAHTIRLSPSSQEPELYFRSSSAESSHVRVFLTPYDSRNVASRLTLFSAAER